MNYLINTLPGFDKKFKKLSKKYRSLVHDLEELVNELKLNPSIGTDLGSGIRKIRIAVSDKGKGKSHGARIISHTAIVSVEKGVVTLLTIYDKNEQDTITKKEIVRLLKELDEN